MSIEIKNVSYVYMPGTPFTAIALDQVSLTIQEGEYLGLIGHTGSGKSTLVQMLNGILKPSSGAVWVDGVDITQKDADLRAVRQKVGLVFQYPEHQLFEETVEKDIAFGPKNVGLGEGQIQERVDRSLERVGLGLEIKERSPFELSGGQRRRVAIAGVLALEPSTLVLDEPTAGLDPRGREDILAMVQGLNQSGCTIVMVSHSMDDVARFATRIGVMNRGKLAMLGTASEIFAQVDALKSMGLDVPEAARLAKELRTRGWKLPQGLFTLESVKEAVVRAWKEGEHA